MLREHAIDGIRRFRRKTSGRGQEIDGVRVTAQPQNRFRLGRLQRGATPLETERYARGSRLRLDRASIPAALMHGTAQEAVADIAPSRGRTRAGSRRCPFAPAEAGRLLDHAGWAMGADGVRRKGPAAWNCS